MSRPWSDDRAAPGAGADRSGDVIAVVGDADDPQALREPVGGAVLAFDADGGERWRWEADDVLIDATLVVAEDAVVVHRVDWSSPDQPGGLCALEAGDGTLRWCEDLDGPAFAEVGMFGPALAVTDDGAVVAADAAGHVRALELSDGTVRWERTAADDASRGDTDVAEDDLQAAGHLLVDGDLVLWSLPRAGEVLALDAGDGSERWRVPSRTRRADTHGLAVTDEVVVVHGVYDVAAFDRESGEQRWVTDLPAPPAGSYSHPDAAPLVHGEVVLTLTSTASWSGQDGRVLHAFDLATGEARWEQTEVPLAAASMVRHVFSALHEVDGRVWLVGQDATAVDPATGELGDTVELGLRWPQPMPSVDGGSVVVDDDRGIRTIDLGG